VLLTSPDGIPMAGLILIHNGKVEDGEKILGPAREFGPPVADLVAPMPYAARQQMLDAGFAIHGWQRYWKSGFVNEISDELIDTMVAAAADFSSPLNALVFFPLHGAATRVPEDATAFSVRRPVFDTNAIAQWLDPSESERHISWIRALWDRIEPFTAGNAYVNHIAADDRPEKVRASFGSNYDRLAQVKAKYDPENLFQVNPNVRPA
jgi:FAD/FMN-containing dehydrogenase